MNVIKSLNWRYAVKQFSTEILKENEVRELLTATRLSASAYGLQPYRLLVVKSTDIRKQLVAHSMGQDKVLKSSHLIVFATQTNIGDETVNAYIEKVAKVRDISIKNLQETADQIKDAFAVKTNQQKDEWARNQTYLALGNFLTCAAIMEIDACPMEGFYAKGYDSVLGLAEKGLTTSVVCPIGKRFEYDLYASMTKVRFDEDEMVLSF